MKQNQKLCIRTKKFRPSQTACTVTTIYVTCMQMMLHMYRNLCTALIPPLCKNNLNLLMCSSFFPALCLVASTSCSLHCHACYLSALRRLFLSVCFYRNQFCSSAINQISLSQSKGWFSFNLLCRQEKYH